MDELTIKTRDGENIKVVYHKAKSAHAPLVVEVHGGGFMYGCALDDRAMCETFCQSCDVNVASVDYRLAPKYKYPTATNDCEDAFCALVADGSLDFDRERTAFIGHSAGANIVAGACRDLKSIAGIRGQILIYPFLNAKENTRKYVFSSFMKWELNKFNNAYFTDKSRRGEFAASPLLGTAEDYDGLPKALVVTAGIDTLRPDGVEYVRILQKYGVECEHVDFPSARHGFFEVVPNRSIEKWWWLSRKSKKLQGELYLQALDRVQKFITRILF